MKQHTKFLWGTTDSVGDALCQKNYVFSGNKPKINENSKFQKIVENICRYYHSEEAY